MFAYIAKERGEVIYEKILAFLLVGVMVFGVSAVVFAADSEEETETVTEAEEETETETEKETEEETETETEDTSSYYSEYVEYFLSTYEDGFWDGGSLTYVLGSGDSLSFTIDSPEVDSVDLDYFAVEYTVSIAESEDAVSGYYSTITIPASYLETLDAGEYEIWIAGEESVIWFYYTLTIESGTSDGTTTTSSSDSPSTGDFSDYILGFAAAAAAFAVCIGGVALYKRRED